MWAGGELHFISPLHVGDVVTRTSRINDVALKEGRAGPLCFVTVRHVWSTALGPAVEERQEIVYRGIGGEKAGATKPEAAAPTEAMWRQSWACDPVLVFRYSAITYNSHRIHYDHAYATGVEGYPDLVVNGPLQATVMAAYATDIGGVTPRRFEFRGVAPLFGNGPFTAKATRLSEGLRLWIVDSTGRTTMTAQASW